MNKEYIYKKVELEINLTDPAEPQLKYSLDARKESAIDVAKRVCEFGSSTFKQMLQHIQIPVQPDPSEVPMITATLRYSEMLEEESSSFEMAASQIEFVEAGRGSDAVQKATQRAFDSLAEKLHRLGI